MPEDNKDVHERLITVEQQQIHQKEALAHISETLDEVVKTQHILANQKREIEQVQTTVNTLVQQFNESRRNEAAKSVQTENTHEIVSNIKRDINERVNPTLDEVNKIKTYLKIASAVLSGTFVVFTVWLRSILGA